jgi:nucleotide sugar dehydrogenase
MVNYRVGVCGLGVVGNAVAKYLDTLSNIDVITYDKYKAEISLFDVLLKTDLICICLPSPYSVHLKTYDVKEINSTLETLSLNKYTGIILIKSTVLPDYCKEMNKLYPDLKIVHNPEFLSSKTAYVDFAEQKNIVLGFTEQSASQTEYVKLFYQEIFPETNISITTSECSALMKLGCNSFYATKIQYFTELYLLCEQLHIPYNEMKDLMLKNEWINPQHTDVPGSDHIISFGGACLPKDISALNSYMQSLDVPCEVLKAVINERNALRDD